MDRDLRKRIGQNIRALAKRAGISLRELAERSKLGEATVYRIANGTAATSAETLAKLAPELDVSVADLLAAPVNVDTMTVRGKPMDHPTAKDTEFRFRLSPHDKAQLEAVAAASSLSASGVIRSLVAREARALGIVVPTPTTKRGRK